MLGVHQNINQVFEHAAHSLLMQGPTVSPRGLGTHELIGATFQLDRPRNRLPILPGRKWSLAYAAGELAWYLAGEDSLEFIRYYAPSYGKFSDDGKRLHGAYGPRIFKHMTLFNGDRTQTHGSAWQLCRQVLEKDRSTRQAVIPIFSIHDLGRKTKDYPCTLTLQFFIRDDQLDMIVTMRSNDLWRGTLYDVFCFTVLQELLAKEMGCVPGSYFHQPGSLHIYESDEAACQKVYQMTKSAPGCTSDRDMQWSRLSQSCTMPELTGGQFDTTEAWIHAFLMLEKAIRCDYSFDECRSVIRATLAQPLLGGGMMLLALLWKKLQACAFEETARADVLRLGGMIRQAVGGDAFDHCFGGAA